MQRLDKIKPVKVGEQQVEIDPRSKTTADKASTDPTDKSIPAVIITTHIPSAIIAIKEKFLVTLNKFGLVANASAIIEKTKTKTSV